MEKMKRRKKTEESGFWVRKKFWREKRFARSVDVDSGCCFDS